MKNVLVLVFAAFSLMCLSDTAKVTVFVCDAHDNNPLEGAEVTCWFENKIGWRAWSEMTPIVTDSRTTDIQGLCRLKGSTNTGKISVEVRKTPDGFYKSTGVTERFEHKSLFGTWQPDNLVVTMALERVENPIPLYVKKAVFPNLGRTIEELSNIEKGAFSYDFLKGDWLPPWGEGVHADVVFQRLPREELGVGVNGRGQKNKSFRDVVTVDFQGFGNGIVELHASRTSELKVRKAVDAGFSSHYEQACGRGKDLQAFRTRDDSKCLCFRVRTKRDEHGNIVEAYYGKIYGDIAMGWSYLGVSSVSFLYYFNPTPNDRNLEWDMKNNLCPNPGDLRKIRP